MVATRHIEPLELILSESPAVVGPYSKSSLGCLECFKRVDGSYICSKCHFPVCNAECETGKLHQAECDFFAEKENQSNSVGQRRSESCGICITPLRMLLKRKSDPSTFARIDMLMDHAEARLPNKSIVSLQLLKVSMFYF